MNKIIPNSQSLVPATAVSLFSGCGGFDWGVKQSGIEIIWANDIDPHAAHAYKGLFPDVKFTLGDVREVTTFPEADILIGCYPCTGFSLGSRRRSKKSKARNLRANSDNFLYTEFLRALKQVRPMYLFVENVGGMISADDGWFFDQQLQGFRRLGYNVYTQVLEASNYGAAQSRKRLFIVGVHEAAEKQYEFLKPTHGGEGQPRIRTMADVLKKLPRVRPGEYFDYKFHGHYLTRNRKRPWDMPSYTIVANAHHVPLHPSGKPMKYVAKDHWKLQGSWNRRLSWKEGAALQGLPESIQPSGSLHPSVPVC